MPMIPMKDQKIALLWQGSCDGTIEGFEVNGMLVVPSAEGVTYIRREDARAFFGLVEPSTSLGQALIEASKLRVAIRLACKAAGLPAGDDQLLTDSQLITLLNELAQLANFRRIHAS